MHHNSTATNVKLCQGKDGVQLDCHPLLRSGDYFFLPELPSAAFFASAGVL